MQRGELIYEGKAKRVYASSEGEKVILEYKDDATAFNGQKRGTVPGKGEYNNKISSRLFRVLEGAGIKTHFLEQLSDRESLAWSVEIVPLEVVVRNVAAGSLAKRLGLDEGTPLADTVVEFYYKDDDLGDPLLNQSHIRTLGLATEAEIAEMTDVALKVNHHLGRFLAPKGLDLIDFKIEFGRRQGELLLADEISPDTCRFWDRETKERLDKDRFRRDLGGVEEAYRDVLRRVGEQDRN